jgi:acetyltransferase-like isoleucine patch superfamily enzyme
MLKFLLTSILQMIKDTAVGLKNRNDVFKKFQVNLKQGCKISNPLNITIGTGFGISPFCQLFAQGELGDAEIVIGDNVALNYNVMINADCGGTVKIGDNVRIGPYTVMRGCQS